MKKELSLCCSQGHLDPLCSLTELGFARCLCVLMLTCPHISCPLGVSRVRSPLGIHKATLHSSSSELPCTVWLGLSPRCIPFWLLSQVGLHMG